MTTWLCPLLGRILANLSMVFTLAVLAGLAWLGHRYDWKVPSFSNFWSNNDTTAGAKAAEGAVKPLPIEDGPPSRSQPEPTLRTIHLESPAAASRAGITLAHVKVWPMSQKIRAYGVLDYDQDSYAQLSTRAAGQAWSVLKKLGDPVRKGDILAVVESPEVGKAKTEFLQALVQLNARKVNLEQMRAVGDKLPESALRNAETLVREARIKVLTDQQALVNLGLPIRSEELERLSDDQMVARVRVLGLPPELLRGRELDTLSANLLPMKAPFDGQVVNRNIVVGETVTPSSPQFILADISRLWVMVDVRGEDAGLLKRDQEVVFIPAGARQEKNEPPSHSASPVALASAGGLPAALTQLPDQGESAVGRIDWISPEVDEKTRTVRVRAVVPNPQRRLRPHTFGDGWITVRSNPDAVVVPNDAIQSDGPLQFVFVHVTDQTFEPREVKTGIKLDGYTEILSGVTPGEKVVKTGSHALKTELFKDRLGGGD